MRKKESKPSIGNIAVLLVFCLLAVGLLMTLLTGVRVYRTVTERAETTSDHRTVSQYVANRIRQADRAGMVSVEDFAGVCALTVRETINGTVYLTRIYCHEGWLCELFAAESSGLSPEDGEQLVQAEGLSVTLEDSLLTVQVDYADGNSQTLTLYLRSGEGALP